MVSNHFRVGGLSKLQKIINLSFWLCLLLLLFCDKRK